MARHVIVRVTDDFDETLEADVTRVLGWDGYDYVLDLSDKNDHELCELLKPYLGAAHEKVKQRKQALPNTAVVAPSVKPPRPKPVSASLTQEKRSAIRQWAREHGIKVGEKGAIAKSIVEAYEDAHPDE